MHFGSSHNEKSSQYGAPPSYSGGEMAEAVYAYAPNGPTDLPLFPGMQVQIIEKMNNDWWRGKNPQNQQEGVFPSNYVRLLNGQNSQPSNNAYPQQQQQQQAVYQHPYPPPSTEYYQEQPQQQVVQQQQQQPQQVAQHQPEAPRQHHLSNGVKKFGGKLGNAAIFGAGASIGSNIVNSIF